MGVAGISVWQLLIVLLIVIMLFGSKRIGALGSDLGSAIRGFRKSVADNEGETVGEKAAEPLKRA